MVRSGTRSRFGWLGLLVAAFLAFAPMLGMTSNASAQSSASDAETLLEDAKDAADGVDPIVDNDDVTLTQEADTVSITYLTDAEEPIGDFYMTFTVEAPRDGDTDPFDFGLFFRDAADDSFVDLVWVSDADGGPIWGFFEQTDNADSGDLDPEVFPVEEGSTYEIEVAAIGDEAAFSVNGEPIGLVDISNNSDPGRIGLGTGFFSDATVAGEDIDITEVTLVSLDEGGSSGGSSGTVDDDETPTPDEDETPVEDEDETPTPDEDETPVEDEDETPTPDEDETPVDDEDETATPDEDETPVDDEDETPTDGDSVVSETYGFTVTYDPDVWEVRSSEATGEDYDNLGLENVDVIDMVNEASNVLFFAGESANTPEECVQADVEFFNNSDRYEFISVAKDQDDEDLEGETASGDGYYTVVWLDDSGPSDTPYDEPQPLTVYIECRPIVDGESVVLIEQYAFDADYNDQIDPRDELLAGIDMSTAGEPVNTSGDDEETPTPDEDEETPTPDEDEETPTPDDDEEQPADDEVIVTLDPVAGDEEGEAVLTPSGSSRTRIVVTTDPALEGALVVVQEGSCDDLAGESAFDAGEIDENGESSGRVRETLDELDGNYAITIIDADTEDFEDPLACGDIG